MFHPRASGILVLLLCIAGSISYAQTSSISNPNSERENNPYSRYGIGELWNGNSIIMKGMANMSSAWQDPYTINSDNPASYSTLALTTFEGGLSASTRTVSDGAGASYTTGTASLSSIGIGIPVGKRAGISFGLRPYSKTYYALVDTILSPVSPIGNVVRSYAGSGSLSYAFIGGAYKFKHLSVGFNLGYMFGNYQSFTTTVPNDTAAINRAYQAEFSRYNAIGGLYWKGGFMYEHSLRDSNYSIRIGGTLALDQNLKQKLNQYQVSIFNFGDTLVNDTSYKSGDQHGTVRLPMTYSLGVMLSHNDNWGVGIDYSATSWSNFHSSVDTLMNMSIGSSSYKISLGGYITPNPGDLTNYFSRVTLRLGFYYGQDYVVVNNTTLPVYGITFGGSFPYKRSLRSHSRLSASFDIGKLGVTTNNVLQQTYVRFGFGLTFNEKWFIPRKYD